MTESWFETLPQFEESRYQKVGMNDLIVFAVYVLAQRNREITYEDIVAASFRMFPARFSLRGYPDWPDSAVINKRWLDCRDKALILGSTKDGFTITAKGLALGQKTEKALESGHLPSGSGGRLLAEHRTRAGRFVRALETSEAFLRFQSDATVDTISEFQFRSMLLCTMESSPETLNSNIEQFRQFANVYSRRDLLAFLDLVEVKFSKLLAHSGSQVSIVRGGMVPKRQKKGI
jgi:hypothetical protein